MASEVRVNPRLRKLLRRMPDAMRDELVEAQAEAAEVLRYEMLIRVPVDDGGLAASIGVRRGPKGKYQDVGPGLAGPRKDRAFAKTKARWKEYGTAPHEIEVDKRQGLSDGETIYGRRIVHPGTPPDPFLKPALEAARPQVKDRMHDAVRKVLRQYVDSNG